MVSQLLAGMEPTGYVSACLLYLQSVGIASVNGEMGVKNSKE